MICKRRNEELLNMKSQMSHHVFYVFFLVAAVIEEAQSDLIIRCLSEGRCSQVSVSLFSLATSSRMRGASLNLHQDRFNLAMMADFFTETVVKPWNGCPGR